VYVFAVCPPPARTPRFTARAHAHAGSSAERALQKLTEEEQKLFRLYGKLPTHKNMLTKMQKARLLRQTAMRW
jgi:hypothetical protein